MSTVRPDMSFGGLAASRVIAAAILVLGLAVPVHAQMCPPTGLQFTPRASNGAFFSVGELEALRAQLPDTVGGGSVHVVSSGTPHLSFQNPDCFLDIEDVTFVYDGMRMRLWFNMVLDQGHLVRIEGPAFQNAEFVFDRGATPADPSEAAPSSAWRPIHEMGRTAALTPPARDCPATLALDHPALLVYRVRKQSPEQRRECLAYLLDALRDTTTVGLKWRAAMALDMLARHGLIDDAAILDQLIACVARQLDQVGMSCNLALNRLTRQSYGYAFFTRSADSTSFNPDRQRRVVDDWREYVGRAGKDPIFLRDESLRATGEVAKALRTAITAALPTHAILPHLRQHEAGPRILEGFPWETITYFGTGDAGMGSAVYTPSDWVPGTPLRVVRFQLTRLGTSRPSGADAPLVDGRRLSAEESTYREEFPNLDLEFRLQIVTTDEQLRAAAVTGVRAALAGLRAADRPGRRPR